MTNKNKNSGCSGSYEVSGYTTKDGKKVDDYIRRCWKHGGGNSVTNFMGEMPNPTEDSGPTPDSDPQPGSDDKTDGGVIWDSIWKTVLQLYLDSLNKNNNENRTYNNYSMAKYPSNSDEPKDLPVNFSTFDIKKTEENIKNSMGKLGEILKQKEVSNKDIDLIRANMKSITGNICNDLENLVNRKSQLPKNPTVESARIADEIEKDKEITRDNIYNAVIMTNQARNAIEKSFENVDTNSPDYYNKLNDHAKKLDEIDKIGKSLRNLSENTLSLRSNIIDLANKIREDLGLLGRITGGAADINNKLAFEEVFIPYENNSREEEFADMLEGHIEKFNENIKEINYEIDSIEEKEDITEEDVQNVLEQEKNIANEICEDCKQLKFEEDYYKSDLYKSIENRLDNTIKINNKIEKITIKNENISDKLKKKVRQITLSLYNLYVSILNKQKEKMIREIYKLKVAFDSARNDSNEKFELEGQEKDNVKWIWPCHGKIVGEYGEKRSDHIHNGIDIAVPVGTPIKAIADGKVVVVGPSEGYGYWVGINHGFVNGIEVSSEYGHISKWVVSKGQYVKQGQIIAYSGNTGHSEGPHVHLTIRHGSPGKGGGKAVSPWDYIIRTKY